MKILDCLALAGFLFLPAMLSGQNKTVPPVSPPQDSLPGLVTEGPDFTDSSDLVGTGVFQIENVFTISRQQGDRSFTGPETLIRFGLSKRFELRLGTAGLVSDRSGNDRTLGWTDFEVATKIRIWDERRWRPALALLPILSIPAGDSSSNGYTPTLKLAWGKNLARGFSLDGNINLASLPMPDGRLGQTAASVSLGHDLKAGFGASVEVFGLSPDQKNGPATWIANSGISHNVGKNAQLEARVGRRITSAGPDWFYAVGTALGRPRQLLVP